MDTKLWKTVEERQVANSNPHSVKNLVGGYDWWWFQEKDCQIRGKSVLATKIDLARIFLESQCTARYGFMAQVAPDVKMRNSTIAVPNIFDNALILDVTQTVGASLSSPVVDSLCQLLLRNRSSQGLWNYFQNGFKFIPDDVDDSSTPVVALLQSGYNPEKLANMAKTIYESAVIYDDGLVDTYVKIQRDPDGIGLTSKILNKWPVHRRVDLGVTSNLLYMLNKMGIEHLPRLAPSYEMLHQALEAIHEQNFDHPVLLTHAKYYINLDLVCFFISRILVESAYAREMTKDKMVAVLMDRLGQPTDNVLAMSSRILAAFNVGLHEMASGKEKIIEETQNLLQIQSTVDFSFPQAEIYNAHNVFYFGSDAVCTAMAVGSITLVRNHFPEVENNFV